EAGAIGSALFGTGDEAGGFAPLLAGALGKALPAGNWHFGSKPGDPDLAALGLLLGGYVFTRYGRKPGAEIRFGLSRDVDPAKVTRLAEGCFLARDLINTPANDMGPEALENAVRALAR